MATDYPGAVDTSSKLPNPAASDKTNSPTHSGLHDNTNDAIKATQTKLGTGASTPVANTLLFGNGTGTSAWTAITSANLRATLSDETGTGSAVFATSPTLVTPAVDTINESTPSNGTTIGGVNIKSGALTTSSSVPTAALQDSSVTSAKLATGVVVQVVNTTSGAVATGTTLIPFDDTIPQITEGDQYMTLAITPKSATNVLVVQVTASLQHSVSTDIVGMIFQDATANALGVNSVNNVNSSRNNLTVMAILTAGTTSSTTFRFRAGGSNAGTTTFNGNASARLYGTVGKSTMIITEYKV